MQQLRQQEQRRDDVERDEDVGDHDASALEHTANSTSAPLAAPAGVPPSAGPDGGIANKILFFSSLFFPLSTGNCAKKAQSSSMISMT